MEMDRESSLARPLPFREVDVGMRGTYLVVAGDSS